MVETIRSTAERINRCVMTETGESERRFRKILQRGNLGLIAVVQTCFQCVIWNNKRNANEVELSNRA